jgi:ABC-type glycerol-3-phosphate transport system permease component
LEKKQTLKLKIAQYTIDLITYLFALLMLFPLYWMIAGSIMTDLEISSIPPVLVPSDFDFGNYIELYRRSPILTWFRNSVWVSAATSFLYVLISAMAGYAYAKKEFFFKRSFVLYCYHNHDNT